MRTVMSTPPTDFPAKRFPARPGRTLQPRLTTEQRELQAAALRQVGNELQLSMGSRLPADFVEPVRNPWPVLVSEVPE